MTLLLIYYIVDLLYAGLRTHLMGWVTGDLHKGTQVTEMMLTRGSTLTAVGIPGTVTDN